MTQTQNVYFPNKEESERYNLHRRFDRFGRLIGDAGMGRLFSSHVMIIGLGGVGSWAAEALARSGVGRITLVDFDDICVTNTNRQIHAMTGVVGQKKAQVMAERMKKINPQAQVKSIEEFYNAETCGRIFETRPEFVVDAIDNLTAKSHLLSHCLTHNIPVITSGGAGSRLDPLQVTVCDLAETHTDPLLQQLRKILRTKYDFPREGAMGIPCVYSTEPYTEPFELRYDKGLGFKCVCPQGANNFHSCDRRSVIHGTASFVTGTFGFVMASHVVRHLLNQNVTPA